MSSPPSISAKAVQLQDGGEGILDAQAQWKASLHRQSQPTAELHNSDAKQCSSSLYLETAFLWLSTAESSPIYVVVQDSCVRNCCELSGGVTIPRSFNARERNHSDAPRNTQALSATEQSVAGARAEVGELENRCRAAEQQAEQLEALLENPETEAAIATAEKAAAAAMQHAEASPLSLTPSYQQSVSNFCG